MKLFLQMWHFHLYFCNMESGVPQNRADKNDCSLKNKVTENVETSTFTVVNNQNRKWESETTTRGKVINRC